MLHELDALTTGSLIADGELSVTEVTTAALERAAALGPQVGAFAHLTPDHALAQAREADDKLSGLRAARSRERPGRDRPHTSAAGDLSPLFGVPCPIKDLNAVAGLPQEAGSVTLAGHIADVDDGVVTLLADAGTIMIGKTSSPEFGFPCYTEPDTGPAARTPWDLTRSAGGSSGGAAAAVAAGIVPLAHASDGGGSIRIPAAACGLVGLKPSRGRVSPGPYGLEGPGLASHGVVSRTVRDTAAALDVLALSRPGDTFVAPPHRTSFLKSCERYDAGITVGVLTTPAIVTDAAVHPGALRAVEALTGVLADLGCEIRGAPLPFDPGRWNAFRAIWSVGAAMLPVPHERLGDLVPLTRWLRDEGLAVTGAQYAAALAELQQLTRDVAARWSGFDVILTPTLAQPPALVGSLRNDDDPAADFDAQTRFTPWTSVANLTGRPSISLPTHREVVDGVQLPFGTMLTGRWGSEALLLALSAAVESVLRWPHPTGVVA